MVYAYKCECGEFKELEFSIQDNHPTNIPCEKCGGLMYRDFKATIQIPEGFGAGTASDGLRFDKSPSKNKHYW